MIDDALAKPRALARSRDELGQRAGAALSEVGAALVASTVTTRASVAAILSYDPTLDDSLRRAMQAAASAAIAPHEALREAIADLSRVAEDMSQGDERIARAARDVHDPARLAAAAPTTSLALLPANRAEGWARGEIEFNEARAFANGIAEGASNAAYLRCEGATCPELALTIPFLPLLEALARRDRVPVPRPWTADAFPQASPNAIVAWVRRVAEAEPQPGQAANALAALLKIRKLVELGARTMHHAERIEIDLGGVSPRMAEPPPPPGRRLSSPDGTHYPAGIEPVSTGSHTIARPTSTIHASTTTVVEEGEEGEPIAPPLGKPAVPDFMRGILR